MNSSERLLQRLDDLISKGQIAAQRPSDPSKRIFVRDQALAAGWRSQSLNFLTGLLGEKAEYTSEFRNRTETYFHAHYVEDGTAILQSLREDIENGYMQSYRQLVEAELLGGLMGQAEYLLEKNYLVPAAAVAGAALQQGLEELTRRHNIKLKNREDLNSLGDKLFQAEILNGIERKQVSLIAGVRNSADHGKTEELTKENVIGMVRDAVNFLAKHAT